MPGPQSRAGWYIENQNQHVWVHIKGIWLMITALIVPNILTVIWPFVSLCNWISRVSWFTSPGNIMKFQLSSSNEPVAAVFYPVWIHQWRVCTRATFCMCVLYIITNITINLCEINFRSHHPVLPQSSNWWLLCYILLLKYPEKCISLNPTTFCYYCKFLLKDSTQTPYVLEFILTAFTSLMQIRNLSYSTSLF